MKKLNKVLSIIMFVLMLACVSTNVFAADITFAEIKGNLSGAAGIEMYWIGATAIGFITNAAMIIAVVVIAVIGVKYMLGSAEEKAEYKKSLMPYLIGAVCVFGASAIAKMVVNIF